ncbi:hypothetical protein BGY98DRAFT_1142809 [Russula aff. rugulosa BPL654]|nr:hypothetical protein BGY98DRAFT_1142809 [Russula aff. rugulosa BPL654]
MIHIMYHKVDNYYVYQEYHIKENYAAPFGRPRVSPTLTTATRVTYGLGDEWRSEEHSHHVKPLPQGSRFAAQFVGAAPLPYSLREKKRKISPGSVSLVTILPIREFCRWKIIMSTIRRGIIGLSKFWLGLRGLLDDTALIRNCYDGRVASILSSSLKGDVYDLTFVPYNNLPILIIPKSRRSQPLPMLPRRP